MSAEAISQVLVSQAVRTWDGCAAANDALHAIHRKVDKNLSRLVEEGNTSTKWSSVMAGNSPRNNFQLYQCKWADLCAGRKLYLRYTDQVSKLGDSSGEFKASATRSRYPEPAKLNDNDPTKLVQNYFRSLFFARSAPLAEMGTLFDFVEREFPDYRVTLSLDYYYQRPQDNPGLHKDTKGTTLLVGLHYLNDQDIQGPEYIYDFWPQKLDSQRPHSPWTKDGANRPYWPETLTNGLEMARDEIKKWQLIEHGQDLFLHTCMMKPFEVITFVDELIYHATPHTARRDDSNKTKIFQQADVHGKKYNLPQTIDGKLRPVEYNDGIEVTQPPRLLTRQFSQGNITPNRGAGTNKLRKFIRFWVMVEPKAWHA